MGIDHPKATSTPTSLYPLRGRKGIRENNSVQSPIDAPNDLNNVHEYYTRARSQELSPSQSPRVSPMINAGSRSPKYQRAERYSGSSQSDSEPSQSESDEPVYEQRKIPPNSDLQSSKESGSTKFKYLVCVLGIAVIAVAVAQISKFQGDNNAPIQKDPELSRMIAELKEEFGTQEEDFWRQIRVSIKEVTVLDQPRSIIFVYESKAKKSMDEILKRVSKAALCYLRDCSHGPVEIQGSQLNTSDIVKDYGKIITRYRDQLEENGVLILEHLEQVPGKSAQAFHYFCDAYNPVVQRALLLFTLEVDKLPDSYLMAFVEKFLLNLWKELGVDDKFYPLFTRISETILSVQTE